jgi:DNA-binding NarL/FixJ family response regulator
VLLADDHHEMLTLASSILRGTCDVVASVTDGSQAVEQAMRLNPDVVVLDISMPMLDGFQVARELRRRGSPAKVVFLSLHEGDEFVSAAFESGGQAFVPKHRMWADLRGAIEHVRSGRVFVPSLSSLSTVAPGGGHAVMLYSRPDTWFDETASLVKVALSRGDTVVVIATEVTREGVAKRLAARGIDTTQAETDGRYSVADVAETLEQITHNGRPDRRRIATVVESLEETRLAVSGTASRMTIIGELAPSLTHDRPDDVLGIERLWRALAGDRPFLTVCAYSMECLHGPQPDSRLLTEVCAEHWAVTQILED